MLKSKFQSLLYTHSCSKTNLSTVVFLHHLKPRFFSSMYNTQTLGEQGEQTRWLPTLFRNHHTIFLSHYSKKMSHVTNSPDVIAFHKRLSETNRIGRASQEYGMDVQQL